jgi:hypothetical protein
MMFIYCKQLLFVLFTPVTNEHFSIYGHAWIYLARHDTYYAITVVYKIMMGDSIWKIPYTFIERNIHLKYIDKK